MKCYYNYKKGKLDAIVEKLRRYPFKEEMLLCQKYSTQLMELTHLNILNNPNAVYPWELEVFAEFSLFADGIDATSSFVGNEESFIRIINKIRNYQHPYLRKQKNMDFVSALIMVTALQQFKSQENTLYRLYRYDYFWHFVNERIDMKKEFSNFFGGLSYSEFRDLCTLIYFYASLKKYSTANIIKALMYKYKEVIGFLSITRENYKCMQSQKIDANYENTVFGFNYLHPYPFIEFESYVYLPLPHLVIDAVTDSLLTRITIDNDTLREKIGKEVAQSYIEKIFTEGNLYDEVLPETTYRVGRNNIDTPDVLIRKGGKVCLIDTKLSTPKLEIRKFNSAAVKDTISRYAKNIIQVYKRVKDFNDGRYYPFEEVLAVERADVFGIVALFEDAYVSRRQVYQEVFAILEIDDDSDEAKYINSHIKITNFRDLELFAFRSYDIFRALTNKRDNPQEWDDLGLFNEMQYNDVEHHEITSVVNFEKASREVLYRSIKELSDLGLINK